MTFVAEIASEGDCCHIVGCHINGTAGVNAPGEVAQAGILGNFQTGGNLVGGWDCEYDGIGRQSCRLLRIIGTRGSCRCSR